QIQYVFALVQALGQVRMQLPQPLDHLLGRLGRARIRVLTDYEIHDLPHILHLDAAKWVLEQQVEIKLKRACPVIRLHPQPLDFVEPAGELTPEMLACSSGKIEARQLDQMQVDLVVKAQNGVLHELSRERHY